MKPLWAILVSLLLTSSVKADTSSPVSVGTLLRQESDLASLPNLRSWTAHLQSSYDRSGGNGDSGNFVARDGQTATLLDVTGPGAVVRLWTANPHGELKIYIDDAPRPVVDVPMGKLFDGSTPPFAAPWSSPPPAACIATCPCPTPTTAASPWTTPAVCTTTSATLPSRRVRPSARSRCPCRRTDQTSLAAAQAAWSAPVWPVVPAVKSHTVRPGRTETLAEQKGPGVVTLVQVAAPGTEDTALRRLVLRAYFDGHKTPDIQAPLPDFFGNAFGRGRGDFASLPVRRRGDIWEARFPMPFGRSARFTLENGNSQPVTMSWGMTAARQPFHPGQDGYFHAQWRQEITRNNMPHIWTTVQGRHGHFLGVVQTMASAHGLGFLEGDEQFRVDGEQWLPSAVKSTVIGPWNGTGTEDCFNSGWYFSGGPNALPLNGALVREDAGRINAYRWFLNDAPVFQSSMDAQIEHGGANDAPGVYYSSVAFWYDDGPMMPWLAMPPAAQITLPQPAQASFKIPGVIEGESLVGVAKATGGQVQEQDMGNWSGQFSGDAQLWWTMTKTGDTLTLPVTVPAAGTYDVLGYFTEAGDYGRFTFTLAGQALPLTLDAFHAGVVSSGPLLLGRVQLPAGANPLIVTVADKNPASSNSLFGLDAIRLRPVP